MDDLCRSSGELVGLMGGSAGPSPPFFWMERPIRNLPHNEPIRGYQPRASPKATDLPTPGPKKNTNKGKGRTTKGVVGLAIAP